MILKARFSISLGHLDALVDQYTKLNGPIKFLTGAGICKDTSEIVAPQNEIMFFIGFVAGLGVHTLECVTKV
jgi:hypothetical protein